MSFADDSEEVHLDTGIAADVDTEDEDDEIGENDLKAVYKLEWFVLQDHEGEMVISCDNTDTEGVRR